MDKWKDMELEKMKVGGNKRGRIFFESQEDYTDGMSIQEKYNSKCAALYRDKVRLSLLLQENTEETQKIYILLIKCS